jgi:hypothetical protein
VRDVAVTSTARDAMPNATRWVALRIHKSANQSTFAQNVSFSSMFYYFRRALYLLFLKSYRYLPFLILAQIKKSYQDTKRYYFFSIIDSVKIYFNK